jgi:hypothetical protein
MSSMYTITEQQQPLLAFDIVEVDDDTSTSTDHTHEKPLPVPLSNICLGILFGIVEGSAIVQTSEVHHPRDALEQVKCYALAVLGILIVSQWIQFIFSLQLTCSKPYEFIPCYFRLGGMVGLLLPGMVCGIIAQAYHPLWLLMIGLSSFILSLALYISSVWRLHSIRYTHPSQQDHFDPETCARVEISPGTLVL